MKQEVLISPATRQHHPDEPSASVASVLICLLQQREVDAGLQEAWVTVCVQERVDAFLCVGQGGTRGRLQQLDGQVSGLTVQVHLQQHNTVTALHLI